jgi:two-component system response regulator AtoC
MSAPAKAKTDQLESKLLPPDQVLFGRSPMMTALLNRVNKICKTDVPVLLLGDAGTGKELLARWMHGQSAFSNGQFVKVNCAAIPGTLLESELFGYEKGAFTGAQNEKPGLVETAHGGTLFLDEIADLDMNLQSKLLHFAQDGTFSRIGGEMERAVSTRIMCATNRDIGVEIEAGRFRADLFYRLSVFQLRLPRLCERRQDIPVIAEYFRTQYQRRFAMECKPLGLELLNYLENLNWPGNIRELSNCVARYVLIGPDAAIVDDLPKRPHHKSSNGSFESGTVPLKRIAKEAVRDMERRAILEALQSNQWNRRKTAQTLKISYRALIYKIRDAGLRPSRKNAGNAISEQVDARPSRPELA